MRIEIYIPSKIGVNFVSIKEREKYLRALALRVSEKFGGCTLIPTCKGFWINGKKQLEEDEITIILVFTEETTLNLKLNYDSFIAMLFYIKHDLKQKALAYSVDNKMLFV